MRAVLSVGAALLLAGCGGHDAKKTEASSAPPVAVKTMEVTAVEWPSVYEAPGTVRARASATVSSKVMGYIRELRVQPGDQVKAGQLLVVIDSRDLESSVKQAEAGEQEARSAIAEGDNGIAAAKAQLGLAQATFRRMETLHKQRSVSDQEFDEAQARLRSAEAMVAMAQSRRAQLDSKIAQAKQGVESASVMRSYSQIHAPFAGVVTEKPANAGQLATPGTPLLTIEAGGAFRMEAPVEESMLGRIRLGQAVTVELDSRTVKATVQEIVPSVDPQSRSFIVKASLPATPNLRTGMYGKLLVSTESRQAVAVPSESVIQRGDLQSVFVADNGVARARMISTGERRDGQVEVLSGLKAGDRVIHPRPADLRDGAKIEVRP